ncbi:Sec-independent protein translocase protein TatA [Pseudomonas sp. JUb42]|jgi:hypothetical protein|uniref:chemotaxis protein n=1 Tax=Pseudomonas sp. JUb42 TaxID=2940611 RepID=UPI002168372B|nr:chemotaxis protein [Pseudomonas sp. JUb42]MCS3468148.1 Sec-independent protein translocase protein TatA [Pseudomonas sp. JUb42]
MQSIGPSILATLGIRPASKDGKSTTTSSATADQPAKAGIQVDLSALGKAQAAKALAGHSEYADIAQSGLPESVQKTLRAVRDTQTRIEQFNQQLQTALKDQSLTPDMRQARTAGLQTLLGALQRQVANSTSDLSSQMSSLQLSQSDKVKAGMLVLAKM